MKDIVNLMQVTNDSDIVQVVSVDTGEVVASGHWYQDSILRYQCNVGHCKPGYRFRVDGGNEQ